ncbi:MAG: hypothetical protein P4L31_06390 [Candidatus Babeliales bacterium]|nr:hypothetical protein [Candidatus Babeliales bacterium]
MKLIQYIMATICIIPSCFVQAMMDPEMQSMMQQSHNNWMRSFACHSLATPPLHQSIAQPSSFRSTPQASALRAAPTQQTMDANNADEHSTMKARAKNLCCNKYVKKNKCCGICVNTSATLLCCPCTACLGCSYVCCNESCSRSCISLCLQLDPD